LTGLHSAGRRQQRLLASGKSIARIGYRGADGLRGHRSRAANRNLRGGAGNQPDLDNTDTVEPADLARDAGGAAPAGHAVNLAFRLCGGRGSWNVEPHISFSSKIVAKRAVGPILTWDGPTPDG